jgi:Class II flagellar assembly regulator
MKITGPGQIQSKAVKKTAAKSGASGAAFSKQVSGDAAVDVTTGVSGSAPIVSVDALWALQEVPDATNGRSKGLMRADEMLDLLEDVRKGILLGAISMPNLRNLADMARNQKSATDDPKLNELLQEIELRAEVELAKLGL